MTPARWRASPRRRGPRRRGKDAERPVAHNLMARSPMNPRRLGGVPACVARSSCSRSPAAAQRQMKVPDYNWLAQGCARGLRTTAPGPTETELIPFRSGISRAWFARTTQGILVRRRRASSSRPACTSASSSPTRPGATRARAVPLESRGCPTSTTPPRGAHAEWTTTWGRCRSRWLARSAPASRHRPRRAGRPAFHRGDPRLARVQRRRVLSGHLGEREIEPVVLRRVERRGGEQRLAGLLAGRRLLFTTGGLLYGIDLSKSWSSSATSRRGGSRAPPLAALSSSNDQPLRERQPRLPILRAVE